MAAWLEPNDTDILNWVLPTTDVTINPELAGREHEREKLLLAGDAPDKTVYGQHDRTVNATVIWYVQSVRVWCFIEPWNPERIKTTTTGWGNAGFPEAACNCPDDQKISLNHLWIWPFSV